MGLFDFFSKDKVIYKPSLYFLNHNLKDKYFFRTTCFHYMDDGVTVVALGNKGAARLITFDDWPQLIFLSATGKITTYQFLMEMAKRYRGRVPERLDLTILEELDKLIGEGIVEIADQSIEIDPEYLAPIKFNK